MKYEDAQDFVAGKDVPPNLVSSHVKRYYGVAVGHHPGVYTDWTEASLQIKDIKRPLYKKFPTRAEAEAFVMTKGKNLEQNLEDRKHDQIGETSDGNQQREILVVEDSKDEEKELTVKNRKISDSTQVTGQKKLNKNLIQVYTDGSARGNGRKGARAGVGVFFGTNDPRYEISHHKEMDLNHF